jgi:hypothetical protein
MLPCLCVYTFMSSGEFIPLLLAFVGGLGGLVNALIWSDMLRALNGRRSAENQIPFSLVTWDDFEKHWPIRRRPFLKEFRQQFPESRLYFWYVASVVWMVSFLVAAAALSFTLIKLGPNPR